MKEKLLERFIKYIQIDTKADFDSQSCPSSKGQLVLARMLQGELEGLGLVDITLDDCGYLFGTLPGNTDKSHVPVIGFMAHLDTAPEFCGWDIKPQIHTNYDGKALVLNSEGPIVLRPEEYPNLANYLGKTLITTDGTTLLGGDDKAGIAEIMAALEYLIAHPEIKHGDIRVAFTPDEEINRGPHRFDVELFDAHFAYTIDGGPLGELQFENFNAAKARVVFKGNNIHPGRATNKLVNAIKMAMEFQQQLPLKEAPEFTDKYEGYFHLTDFYGSVEEAVVLYTIRDFSLQTFEARKGLMISIARAMQEAYGSRSVSIQLQDQYYNMREKIDEDSDLIQIPKIAMKNLGIQPVISPVRGGTDGAQLTYMGLLTPNLFIGGENFHGKYEFACLEDMVKAAEVIVEIARLYEEQT